MDEYASSFSDIALSEAVSLSVRIPTLSDLPIVQGITLDPPASLDLDDAF